MYTVVTVEKRLLSCCCDDVNNAVMMMVVMMTFALLANIAFIIKEQRATQYLCACRDKSKHACCTKKGNVIPVIISGTIITYQLI